MPINAFVLLVLVNAHVLDPGTYSFRADEREVGQVVVESKTDKVLEFRIEVPAGAKKLSVERSKTGLSRMVPGRNIQTYDVISVAGITKPMREERPVVALETLPARVDALLKALASEMTSEQIGLAFGSPQSVDALKEAEERLGFQLDPELVAVLSKLGSVRFGDSGMTEAAEFARTDQQFEGIWGAPETVRDEETRNLYRNSTMMWVEAGDGYGAVLYAPEFNGSGSLGQSAGYWNIHQDTISKPMVLKRRAQSGPLSGALMEFLIEDLLTQIEDQGNETQLLVDPSMSEPFPVWLFTDAEGTPRLKPDWTRHF